MRTIRKNRYVFALLYLVSSCRTATFQSTTALRPEVRAAAPSLESLSADSETSPQAADAEEKTSSSRPPTSASVPASGAPLKTVDVTETFIQTGKPGPVDILIVIDDSDSMTEEQKNLSSKMGDLLIAVKDSDWQIGVITTSVVVENKLDSCKLTLIKASDSQFEEKFRKAVTPGISGEPLEEGIRQAVNGLRCTQAPWVRPNASVAVLIVSDEDNCSNGLGCRLQPSNSEQYLINYVERDLGRVIGANAGFYGIFSPPASPCGTATNSANQYQKLVNYKAAGKTNFGNICDASYKETLQRISANISHLLLNQFSLKQKPDEGTVTVNGKKADGAAITPADVTIAGSALRFVQGHEPTLNSKFEVNYTVTKAP